MLVREDRAMSPAQQMPEGDAPSQGHGSDLSRVAARWWLVVLLGLLGVGAGIIVLAWPGLGLVTLAWITGIFLLVDGVLELGTVLTQRTENRGVLTLLGALSVIAGLFLIRHPVAGVVAIALLLGIWFLILGLLRLSEAVSRSEGRRVWDLIVGLVELIIGVIIVSDAHIGITTLSLIVGIGFILRGLFTTAIGWLLRATENAA